MIRFWLPGMKHRISVRRVLLAGAVVGAACGPTAPPAPLMPTQKGRLAALPAESGEFPSAAKTATDFLSRTRVRGLGEAQMGKVSIEIAQLAIECNEQSTHCYAAVGKSLDANQLLFAKIDRGPKPESCKVTVGLFDVDTGDWSRQASKIYDTEADAVYALREVIEEATRP